MNKSFKLFIVTFLLIQGVNAQSTISGSEIKKSKKGVAYFAFGSHRAWYTKSDITLISQKNPAFNFTLNNARARDDQGLRWDDNAPQYSYEFGYYFKKKNFGIEFQFHHLKYIMRDDQVIHMTGQIDGTKYDLDTLVTRDFIAFQHCDGANYAMLNYVKWKNLLMSKNQKNSLDLVLKAGAGLVIPKTESTIMGKYYHDKYAISGYVVGLEGGLRFNFLTNGFLETSFKGAYANYSHFLIADGHGHQHWFSGQINLLLGFQIPL